MATKEMGAKPRRSESRRRKFDIHVRVDQNERDELTAFAKAVGLSLSCYLRDSGLKRRFTKATSEFEYSAVSELAAIVDALAKFQRRTANMDDKATITEITDAVRAVSDLFVSHLL